MRRPTKIALIVVGSVLLAVVIALILFFVLRPKATGVLATATDEIRDLVKNTFNTVLKIVSSVPLPLPDLYGGCSGSTINRLKFCGNLKYSGSFDVGGSVACSLPYNACRAGCTVLCEPCHLIPFVSCKVPCTDCPNACKRVFDKCNEGTKAEWSVNVLEAFDIGNTMSIADFSEFSLRKSLGTYILKMQLVVAASPKANVDIRTTAEIGNFQGNVDLGNLKITVPLELVYACNTGDMLFRKLDKLQIDGIDLHFEFTTIEGKLKEQIYKLAKGNIENTLRDTLQDKLTSLFKDFIKSELLPRLKLNIPC